MKPADTSQPTHLSPIDEHARRSLLTRGRTANTFTDEPVTDEQLLAIYEIAKFGPTSANINPLRILFVRAGQGRTRLARFGWPLVDVRDIADLHLRAMTAPDAAGQRYIGAGPFAWMDDIAHVLRERMPALAARVPRRALPNVLVRLSGRFDPLLRERLYELSKHRPVSADKARRELGWTPRSNDDAIVATAESLARVGAVET